MFKWLREFWKAKVQINITLVYPARDIERITAPKTEVIHAAQFKYRNQSHYRFVGIKKVEHDGTERVYYHTEYYERGDWRYADDTLSSNKDEAMQLHLKYVEKGSLKPTETKTVFWQGLDREETATWVLLQTENKDE